VRGPEDAAPTRQTYQGSIAGQQVWIRLMNGQAVPGDGHYRFRGVLMPSEGLTGDPPTFYVQDLQGVTQID
jgi:hypothetical protein